ncbi:MAG: hypothetical protein WDM94_02475 [Bauldia sp.]
MLTDIFAHRYASTQIWTSFGEQQRRLIVQAFRILAEQVCPFYVGGNESDTGKAFWIDIHNRLSMELGVKSLSPHAYAYTSTWMGKPHQIAGTWPIITVCENWMLKAFDGTEPAGSFIMERLSLVEIGFRTRGDQITEETAKLPATISAAKLRPSTSLFRLPGDLADGLTAANVAKSQSFLNAVAELNTRFQQAGAPLHYHNGFIQLAPDNLSTREVDAPFWTLLADPRWRNVDVDMKEAVDRRDTAGRDPALYAARALESTIKVISEEMGWTQGRETGAHNFIDNLASNRAKFIEPWEAVALKHFFTAIRNPLSHGPGSDTPASLTKFQTEWAIGACMVWIKALIRRMPA